MFKTLFASALVTVIAGSAMAADLPRRSAANAPSPTFTRAFNWTGLYAGLNAGYDFGQMSKSAKNAIGNVSGYSIGGTVGYNHQMGQFVIGAEGDLAWADIDGATGANKAQISSIGTLRARAGFAADRALVYATGGYAGGNVKVTTAAGSATKWEHGYAIGAGLEYAFTNTISAKTEYVYSSLSSKNYNLTAVNAAGANVSAIRTGVNFKF